MAREFERTLPVPLSVSELIERGAMLASEQQKRDGLEIDKKAHADEIKRKIDAASKEITRLSHIVHDKAEDRPVRCRETRDYVRGVVEVIRLDTGELVESRVMSEHERQREIQEIGGEDRSSATA
jgi:hypothetical protein